MLERLLAAWRETFDEALVEPIARLGAEAAKTRRPPAGKTQAALEAAWHAMLAKGDPADLDVLLATKWPKKDEPLLARLEALANAPPDPRVGPRLLELRAQRSPAYDVAISRVLARAPTEQLALLLDGYPATRFGLARAALENVKRSAASPALVEEARALLAPAIEPRMAKFDPADLAARAVLADELQAAGDPRGEFIALQLAIADGVADAPAYKREAKLLAQHAAEWLRPFPNALLNDCRFERGMPVAIATTVRGRALDLAIDRPEWATVEELTIDGRDADLARLIRRMPRLRMLSTRDDVLVKLAASTTPFPGILALGVPSRWFPDDLRAFPDCKVLAGAWMRDGDYPDLYERMQLAGRRLGLRAIVYARVGGISIGLRYRAVGPPLVRFTVSRDRGRGWWIEVENDTAKIEFAGGDTVTITTITAILDALLAAGMRAIAISAEGRARADAEYHLRARKKRFAQVDVQWVRGSLIDLSRA
jgi:uncharacterized protein (TIGR02996 family)